MSHKADIHTLCLLPSPEALLQMIGAHTSVGEDVGVVGVMAWKEMILKRWVCYPEQEYSSLRKEAVYQPTTGAMTDKDCWGTTLLVGT